MVEIKIYNAKQTVKVVILAILFDISPSSNQFIFMTNGRNGTNHGIFQPSSAIFSHFQPLFNHFIISLFHCFILFGGAPLEASHWLTVFVSPFSSMLAPTSNIRHDNFRPSFSFVTLVLPPLDSETGWTGELWSNTNLLNWQN